MNVKKIVTCMLLIIFMLLCTNAMGTENNNKPSYWELGINSSLRLFRPSVGYWWNPLGVRFSGIYLAADDQEFQFDLGYAFHDSHKIQHSINLVTFSEVGSDPGADYDFIATGVTYSVNYRGLFLELGLAVPWKDDIGNLENDPVVPCLNWGYIYRFRSK